MTTHGQTKQGSLGAQLDFGTLYTHIVVLNSSGHKKTQRDALGFDSFEKGPINA
jgi:hypothetical protein